MFSGGSLSFADGDVEECSPQDCAGRSLCPAEARNCIRIVAFPAGHGPKTFPLRRLRIFEPRSSPTANCI